MTGISGKVVLITGATGNLGCAVAIAFQEAGARMILVGRSTESLSLASDAARAVTRAAIPVYGRS